MDIKVLETLDCLISESGLQYRDLRNLPIIKDYAKMMAEGEKKAYIYAVLAEKHHLCTEQIARICRRQQIK